jgi:SAM-dependent methyltransferase
VTDVWSERAEAYRARTEQAEGEDLELLARWAAGCATVLDVATGGGHAARRLREAGLQVTTLDPAPGMAADVLAPAEHIPFADASFDAVVCRIAPHHFPDVGAAVREMARVSRRLVLIEDTLFASEEVERAERLRDPSHVRSYTEKEWRGFLGEAGVWVEEASVYEMRHPLDGWLARTGASEGDQAEVRRLLEPHVVDGAYVDRKLLLKGRK